MDAKEYVRGRRVLIVDDEQDVLDSLAALLDVCKIDTALTFEQGKRQLQENDYDLAILDIMGVDGYGLLELANKKNIPAVMLTAHAFTPDNLVRSIKEGAASYLPKEEMQRIAEFLEDVLRAREKGTNPWEPWQEKLPSSYFEKRFGAVWKASDKEFLEQFKERLKAGKKAKEKSV